MIKLYKKNPKRFVICMFLIGIILILTHLLMEFHIPERLERNISNAVKTPYGSYSGSIELGIVDGNGNFTWKNDDFYSGEFEDNKLHGEGEITFAKGGYYSGDFQKGLRNGNGIFKWSNGNIYEGSWNKDAITGEGTIEYTNGDKLEGFFHDGNFMSGVFSANRPSGEYTIVFDDRKVTNVTIKFSNGIIYIGDYRDNSFNGEGSLTYENGDKYTGDFVNGKKDGNGTYTWSDGSYYIGEWSNDKMNGEGEYYYNNDTNGYKLSGNFFDNKPYGTMKYYITSNKSYSTKWKDGNCIEVME